MSLRVANAVRPDFGRAFRGYLQTGYPAALFRLLVRRTTLPCSFIQILRRRTLVVRSAESYKERAFAVENTSRPPKWLPVESFWHLAEHHRKVSMRVKSSLNWRHSATVVPAFAVTSGFLAKLSQTRRDFSKSGSQDYVQQSSLTVCPDLRHAGQSDLGQPFSGLPAFELTAPSGSPEGPVYCPGQKRQRPGMMSLFCSTRPLTASGQQEAKTDNSRIAQAGKFQCRFLGPTMVIPPRSFIFRHMVYQKNPQNRLATFSASWRVTLLCD